MSRSSRSIFAAVSAAYFRDASHVATIFRCTGNGGRVISKSMKNSSRKRLRLTAADPVEAAFTALMVCSLTHHRYKYSASTFDGSGTNCGNSLETKQSDRSAGTTAKDAFQANRRL